MLLLLLFFPVSLLTKKESAHFAFFALRLGHPNWVPTLFCVCDVVMLLCLLSSSILLVGWLVIMIESTFLFWLCLEHFFFGQSPVSQLVKKKRELTRCSFFGERINEENKPGVT
jgi:hypothetical protein